MKKIQLITILIFFSITVQAPGAQESKKIEFDYTIHNQTVDITGKQYIRYNSRHPNIFTFVNKDGTVTVCTMDSDGKNTYIYELSMNLELQKKLTVPNEYNTLGAFTKDEEGNYYFFFAKIAAKQTESNMAVQKYNSQGEKVLTFRLTAMPSNSFSGVRVPFNAGTCRMELSGSMLAVYFAREMFNGHQASYGFIIDKESFERIDTGAATNAQRQGSMSQMPYVSHSFNQFILPIEDGFLFTDHGDAYPRSFTFAKFIPRKYTMRVHAYTFVGSTGANPTYAEMGGVAKTAEGYIFLGTCGKGNRNNPRNLMVLTFDDEMKACSRPNYITNYTKDTGHAGHPKIVQIDEGKYFILWEMYVYSTQPANSITGAPSEYISAYSAVIDDKGTFLFEIKELKDIRLNMNDILRYNPVNKKVYWAIYNSSNSIMVYALDTL